MYQSNFGFNQDHSGIPGSPRTAEQIRANKRVEESKVNDTVSSQEEQHLILQIVEATKKGSSFLINSEEAVYSKVIEQFSGIVSEDLLQERQKRNAQTRKKKKEKMRVSVDMLKILDDNLALTEIHNKIRGLGFQYKASKKSIEDGLKDNFTVSQLLLQKRDEMNLTLMGEMLLEDQYSILLEYLNKMNILKESNAVVEDLANDIFNNIGRHLRINKNLRETKAFIEALQNYPVMGLLIYVYANQEINKNIKLGRTNIFLSNLDTNNEEHLKILGKVLKLCDNCFRNIAQSNIILTSDWYTSLQVAYNKHKQNLYFEIPILPKKGKLFKKCELLQLQYMEWNVFHEIVRRKKWNLFFSAYPIACAQGGDQDWYFQKDTTSHSPFMNFLQGACFDDIRKFMQFVDVEQANGVKLFTSNKIQECVTTSGKNVFHLLLMNKDPSQEGLLATIQNFIERLGPDASVSLLSQAWGSGYIAHKVYAKIPKTKKAKYQTIMIMISDKIKAAIKGENDKFSHDLTPLVLYLDRLTCCQLKDIPHINTIIKHLSEHLVKKDNSILRSIYNLNLTLGIEVDNNHHIFYHHSIMCQDFYQDHQQVVKCLINLDDQIFDLTFKNFSWIHWIGPSKDLNSPILLVSLIKAFKFTQVTQIIDLMMDTNLLLLAQLDSSIQLDEEQKCQYEEFYQVEKSRILVACLVALKQIDCPNQLIQEDKLTLHNSIWKRLTSILLKSPNILFKKYGSHTTLLNQIYLSEQEAIMTKLPLPDFSQNTNELILEILEFAQSKKLKSLLESDIIEAMIATVDDKSSFVKYFGIATKTLLKIFPLEFLNRDIDYDMKVFIDQPSLIQNITDNINRLKLESKERKSLKSLVDPSEECEEEQDYTCEFMFYIHKKFDIELLQEKVLDQRSDDVVQFFVNLYKLMEACEQTQCPMWDRAFLDFIYYCLQQPPSQVQLYAGQTVSEYFQLLRRYPFILNEQWMKKLFLLFLRQENYCGLHHLLLLLTTQGVSLFNPKFQYHYLYKSHLQNYFEAASNGSKECSKKNFALSLNNNQFAAMMNDVGKLIPDTEMTGLCNILAVNGLYEKLKFVVDKVQDEVELLKILERTSCLAYHQVQDIYAYVYITKEVEQDCDQREKSVWNRVETFYPAEIHKVFIEQKQPVSPIEVIDIKQYVQPTFLSKWSKFNAGQLQCLMNGIYKKGWPLSNRLKPFTYVCSLIEIELYKREYKESARKSFLQSKPSTVFEQRRDPPIDRDYSQAVGLLVDQVLSKKIMRRNMSPEVGELAIKIISYCWLALGNFEKMTELLSQTQDPYNKRAIVKLVKNATRMFSDKSIRRNIDLTTFNKNRTNLFKTRILTNLLPQLTAFIKKHFNSSVLPAMPANQDYFYANIKSVFNVRHQELTLYQRFLIEFVSTIDSNFTPQQITQIPIDYVIQGEQKGMSFGMQYNNIYAIEQIPILLLNFKTNDKKVVSFLKKHLSNKSVQDQNILRDLIHFGNHFIISMAMQGVNCFMESPNIARLIKGKIVTFKHLELFVMPISYFDNPKSQQAFNDQVSDPKLNLLEYLLFKGAYSLLDRYFLAQLMPKSGLTEPENRRLIMCALQSDNAGCLQIVYDQILTNSKSIELKTLLNYNLMQATAMSNNPEAFLYLITKKLNLVENFTKDDIYNMAGLNSGQTPLLAILAHKHQSDSYKKFFNDYVYEYLLQSNDADFRDVMEKIFFHKFEGMNMLEYCLSYNFYDVVQTFCRCGLVYPQQELEQHKSLLESSISDYLCHLASRSTFVFQSGQSLDNQFRKDYQKQIKILQTFLWQSKFYKSKDQQYTNKYEALPYLNRLAAVLFVMPYNKTLKQPEKKIGERMIQLLSMGKLQFSSLEELTKSDVTKDISGKLFMLHMNGVDKQLQYTISIDKFVQNNPLIEKSEVYTQVWKNKSILELVSIIVNDNITEGFRHKFAHKPTRQEILQLCYTSLPRSGGTNLLIEYFATNEPSLFTNPLSCAHDKLPQSIYDDLMGGDLRFMMIVVRGVAGRGIPELLEELMTYLVDRANEILVTDVEQQIVGSKSKKKSKKMKSVQFKKKPVGVKGVKGGKVGKSDKNSQPVGSNSAYFKNNILTAFMMLLIVNPQRYSKTILQHLKQIKWLSNLQDDHPPAAQILSALYNFEGSFQSLSNGLMILLDELEQNTTYSLISQVGDLGVNINDEKIYLDGITLMVEAALKQTQQKVSLPSDTLSRIISDSVKQNLSVHADKIFKGFAIMKVFVDMGREIENLSNQLRQDPNQRGDLEYRIEVLQADSANKQPVIMLQQSLNQEAQYKFVFISPLNSDPSQQFSIYLQPQLNQTQVEQADQTVSQVYPDKLIKIKWSEDLTQLEKQNVFVKVPWDAINTKSISHYSDAIYNLFGLLDFDTYIQTQLSELQESKFDCSKSKAYATQIKHEQYKANKNIKKLERQKRKLCAIQPKKEINKLIIEGKQQDIPSSNYIMRQRETNLNFNLENEIAFIELHGRFRYQMIPTYNVQIVSELEFLMKIQPTALVHQAIGDLHAYSAMTAESTRVENSNENKKVEIEWPVYFDTKGELGYHRDCHPYSMITTLQSRFDDYLASFIPFTYEYPLKISILSVLETTVLRLVQIFEKNLQNSQSIEFNAVVDLALQWHLPKLVILTILEMLEQIEGRGQAFKSIYVEMSEVEPKESHDSKELTDQLEGLDQIFRLAPCCFFVHKRTLVVRLNVCVINNDPTPIENMLLVNSKLKHFTDSHLILQENSEFNNYMNSIISKESMLAQILNTKRQ